MEQGWLHGLSCQPQACSGAGKHEDELGAEGWSVPVARRIAQAGQKVSALRWRPSVLWADSASISGADYLLLLGHPIMGSHHLPRQLISGLWDNSRNEKCFLILIGNRSSWHSSYPLTTGALQNNNGTYAMMYNICVLYVLL